MPKAEFEALIARALHRGYARDGRLCVTALLVVIAAVYGLLIGSFLNAWAWRLAHHESITKGRSHCPQCGHQIRAYDNIPVVSWLLLRGRCRDCGAPISWRYPLRRGAHGGASSSASCSWTASTGCSIPHLLFVSALVLVSQVDLEIRIIPDVIILPVAAAGVPLMILFGDGPWWEWLVAGAGAAGFLFLISEVYYRVRHVEGMGFGDVKLALCMGIYLGAAVIPALFIGFLSGAIIGVDHRRREQGRRQDGDPLWAVPRGRRGRGALRRHAAHRRLPQPGARALTPSGAAARLARRAASSMRCAPSPNVIRVAPTSSSRRWPRTP